MKLSNFNGAIRRLTTPPRISVNTSIGTLELELQKAPLMTKVKDAVDGDRYAETGITVHDNGLLTFASAHQSAPKDPQPVPDLIDEDLLGGDDEEETTALDLSDDDGENLFA